MAAPTSPGPAIVAGGADGRPTTPPGARTVHGAHAYPSIVRKMPAATTVPMTPAKFGPMANISR